MRAFAGLALANQRRSATYFLYIYIYVLNYVSQVREAASTAGWRSSPLSHGDVIARLLARGHQLNPLLEAPWVKTSIFRRDWLHCSDQGVAADFLGNLFHHLQWRYLEETKKERYAALYQDIDRFYADGKVQDRLDCLLEGMVEQSKGYKLRCSAAECRALVPFGYSLACELCDLSDPLEEAIYFAAFHLNEVYKTLSSDCQDPHRKKSEHGIKFALQYVGLHDMVNPGDPKAWRIKPKLHLFLHVCAEDDLPSMNWCYRDEDFGGSAAARGRRRGGLRAVQAMSSSTLDKFKVHTRFISIR